MGIDIDTSEAQLLGVFDHIYENNFKNNHFGTHYVVSTYFIRLDYEPEIHCDKQHGKLCFFEVRELKSNDKIHKYTRNYSKYIDKIVNTYEV